LVDEKILGDMMLEIKKRSITAEMFERAAGIIKTADNMGYSIMTAHGQPLALADAGKGLFFSVGKGSTCIASVWRDNSELKADAKNWVIRTADPTYEKDADAIAAAIAKDELLGKFLKTIQIVVD
jgi:hypothetical protein